MVYIIGRFIFFVLFKLLSGFKVYGKKNIPKCGGFLVASNHASNLDPILIGVANRRLINYMGKAELFHNKFFAFILRCVHVFPVKRDKANLSSIKEAIRRLKKGEGLLLFPQGGRRESINLDNLRSGIGLLASKARVPVVPAFIKGSGNALPKGARFPHLARITVTFGKALYPQDFPDYAAMAKEAMLAIQKIGESA